MGGGVLLDGVSGGGRPDNIPITMLGLQSQDAISSLHYNMLIREAVRGWLDVVFTYTYID